MGFQGSDEARLAFGDSGKDVDFQGSGMNFGGSGDIIVAGLRGSEVGLLDSSDIDGGGLGDQGETVIDDFCCS